MKYIYCLSKYIPKPFQNITTKCCIKKKFRIIIFSAIILSTYFIDKKIKMLLKTLAILISIFGSLGSAMQCMHPPPAPGYTDQKYSGTWYEVEF